MKITGLQISVGRPDANKFCALEDEAFNDAHIMLQIQSLKKSRDILCAHRDEHVVEEDQIAALKTNIAALQKQLEDNMRSMDCLKPHENRCDLEKKVTDQANKLAAVPLGQQYVEATWWLCRPTYPPFVGTRERKLCEVKLTLIDCATHMKSTLCGPFVAEFEKVGNKLLETWTMRYTAIARLFHETARAGSECGIDWPEFANRVNVSAQLADWVSGKAFEHGETLNPCVAQVMSLLLPIQQQERAFLSALGSLACNRAAFIEAVRSLRDLICTCNANALAMTALDDQLAALSNAASTSMTVDESAALREQISVFKCQMLEIEQCLARRRDMFDEKMRVIDCQIKQLMTEGRCEGNDSIDSQLPDAPVIMAGAPCGFSLQVSLSFFEPGLAVDYSMDVYAHHEQQIAAIKAQLAEIKVRQTLWIDASTRFSLMDDDQKALLMAALNDMEKNELQTILKGSLTPTQMSAAAAHEMVCYWTRVVGNLEMQLTTMIREQTEGIVSGACGSNTIEFPNFNWSHQGLFTIKLTDETHCRSYYQTVNLVVIPDQRAQGRTFDQWMDLAHEKTQKVCCSASAAAAAAPPPVATTNDAILPKAFHDASFNREFFVAGEKVGPGVFFGDHHLQNWFFVRGGITPEFFEESTKDLRSNMGGGQGKLVKRELGSMYGLYVIKTADGSFRGWWEPFPEGSFKHAPYSSTPTNVSFIGPLFVNKKANAPLPNIPELEHETVEDVDSKLAPGDRLVGSADRASIEKMFSSPHEFVENAIARGDSRVKAAAAAVQDVRTQLTKEIMVQMAADLKKPPSWISDPNISELLVSEDWDTFFETPQLFGSEAPAAPAAGDACGVSDDCHAVTAKTVELSERQRVLWSVKLARVAQRTLWLDAPNFSLVFFTQCDYAQLSCAIDDRSLNMRWSTEELGEFQRNSLGLSKFAVGCNGWLQDMLIRLRDELKIHDAVTNTRDHPLLLLRWYGLVSDLFAEVMSGIAQFDAWLDCVSCPPETQGDETTPDRQDREGAQFKRAIYPLMTRLHDELKRFTLPRCIEPSRDDVKALLLRIKTEESTLANNWHHLVDTHLMLTHLFNVDAPWKTVFDTCQPLELMDTLIALCSTGVDVDQFCKEMATLDAVLRDIYIPALIKWLEFSLNSEIAGYTAGHCISELLSDNLKLKGEIADRQHAMSKLLEAARAGEEIARSYKMLLELDGSGLLFNIKSLAQEALPRQPVFATVSGLINGLKQRYDTEGLEEWNRGLTKFGSVADHLDLVTGPMGDYADRWERHPLLDSAPLLSLRESPIVRPGFSTWLKEMAGWLRAVSDASGGVSLVPALFSAAAVATPHTVNTPTMAHLMCLYRDIVCTSSPSDVKGACAIAFKQLAQEYFVAEYRIAFLFRELAREIARLSQLMLDDLLSLRLCLGFACPVFHNTWSAEEAQKVSAMICSMHDKMPSRDEYAQLFEFVRTEYAHQVALETERTQQDAEVINNIDPTLGGDLTNRCLKANSAERQHLISLASQVFKYRNSSRAEEVLVIYQMLIDFLEKHFLCVPESADACKLGSAYVAAINEKATAELVVTSLKMQRASGIKWRGTSHEFKWRNLGVLVWGLMIDIQIQVIELAYDSPGCNNVSELPKTKWEKRNPAISDLVSDTKADGYTREGLETRLHQHLAEIYEIHSDIAHFLIEEHQREQMVTIETQRLVSVPDWAHMSALQLFPEIKMRLSSLSNALHLQLVPVSIPRAIKVTVSDFNIFDKGTVRDVFLSHPLIVDPALLESSRYPMNDLPLSRAFYRLVADAGANGSLKIPTTAVVTLMRYHAAREAAHLVMDPNDPLTSHVPFGNVFAARASSSNYLIELLRFFYIVYANNIDIIKSWSPGRIDELIGPNPEQIVTDPGHRFTAFIRDSTIANAYLKMYTDVEQEISKEQLLGSDGAKLSSNASSVWLRVRYPLLVLAFAKTLEARGDKLVEWFFTMFLPTFIALEMYTAGGLGQNLLFDESIAIDLDQLPPPPIDLLTLIIWMIETVKVVENEKPLLDTIVESVKVMREQFVFNATNASIIKVDSTDSPIASLLSENSAQISDVIRGLYDHMRI
jgi:hypothetical protein